MQGGKAFQKYNQKVVILVDEYDKPILDNIENIPEALVIRDGMRDFYTKIKDNDEYLRFAFLTGVSKFSKVSLFSGLNNLEDISLNPDFGNICGYTQLDVETVFVFPWAVVMKNGGITAYVEILIFFFILGLGLLYAWKKHALKWE
jgi:hypothetical protein